MPQQESKERPYRLGIDVGTSSVGLACFGLDEEGLPTEVVYHSVRIFREPVVPSKTGNVGLPKKAERREHRQARRQHLRNARRLRGIAHRAHLLGLSVGPIPSDGGQQIHALRARAATERITLEELFQVLMHLAKRRGYSGGFRERKAFQGESKVKAGIDKLHELLDAEDVETFGQYQQRRFARGESLKLKESKLYVDRETIQDEFEVIWEEQSKHHPILSQATNSVPVKQEMWNAIFHQRPLKSVENLVGKCGVYGDLPRAPAAVPIAQAFRIEKQIADLRWTDGKNSPHLSAAQRDIVREQCRTVKAPTFSRLYKQLAKEGHPPPSGYHLNFDYGDREELKGDTTRAGMRGLGLLDEWDRLDVMDQNRVITLLADVGSPEVFAEEGWHHRLVGASKNPDKRKPRTIRAEVVEFIRKMVDSDKFDRLSKMKFDSGRSAYSVKALNQLVPIMQKEGRDEYEALDEVVSPEASVEGFAVGNLGSHANTGNTVIDVALRQVRGEINKMISELGGPPAEVIVELSREMRSGTKGRNEQIRRMKINREERRNAQSEIEKNGGVATPSAITRYRLWTEQDQSWCPYCTQPIGLQDALDGNQTHFEHILPRSLTRRGKKRDYLVLAHRSCNDEKGDRSPFEAWGDGRDPARWAQVEDSAEKFDKAKQKGKAKQLRVQHYQGETLTEAALEEHTERQFQETAWIAKLTADWLRSTGADVSVSRGQMTAHLRRIWGLDTVIPDDRIQSSLPVLDEDGEEITASEFEDFRPHWEAHAFRTTNSGVVSEKHPKTNRRIDKRIDHRHHLIDALVIGLTDRRVYRRLAENYKRVTEAGSKGIRLYTPPPIDGLRRVAAGLVAKCHLSHRPDYWPQGNLFLEQPLRVVETETGEERYVLRKLLSDLGKAPKIETVRGRIDRIVGSETRACVLKAFNARIQSGDTPVEALAKPIQSRFGHAIKKVRLYQQGNPDERRKVLRTNREGVELHNNLNPVQYAWLEFDPAEDGALRLVRLEEALRKNFRVPDPPVRVFRKYDTVRDERDGRVFVVHQILAKAGGTLKLALPTEARVVDDLKGREAKRNLSGAASIGKLTIVKTL